jgi:TetR/AcrR family transcriptional regulator
MPRIDRNVRQNLLEAAQILISERGPDGVSVDEIVRKAGCNKRMVYHYFGDKEGLCRAVLLDAYKTIAAFEQTSIKQLSNCNPQRFIEGFISDQLAFLSRKPRIVSLLMWENLNRGRIARTIPAAKTKNPMLNALRSKLSGKSASKFREIEQTFISLVASSFFTFSNRYTLRPLLGFDPATKRNLKQRKAHLIKLFIGGVLSGRRRTA